MGEQVVLVTGGSRGIGRAVCVALAQRGPIAINYRTQVEEAKETLSLVEGAGGEGMVVEADVRDVASVETMFERVEEALGPVSILVNNAGIRSDALAARMSDEAWNDVVQTNLFGSFACTRRALRAMIRAGGGRIVNISSVAGLHGNPGQANYGAAKAGQIALTRSLAREVARKGITVNAVVPGLIDTDLTATLTEDSARELIARIPAGRAGRPEEIAHVVTFLCSKEASYLTGAVIVADGGMSA